MITFIFFLSWGQDVYELSDSMARNAWNTPECVCSCLVFYVWREGRVISVALTHKERAHVVYSRERGLSVSLSI